MTNALHLKISLEGANPKIWREFWITDDISFNDLHQTIQLVMGWSNYHLYAFSVGRMSIGIPHEDYIEDMKDARKMKVSSVLNKKGSKIRYEYDFGDGWMHQISVKKITPAQEGVAYPFCTGGERNCPPEDCGGIWGYEELCEIIKNKKHPEHKDMMEWLGGGFNPEYFNLKNINMFLSEMDEDWDDDGEWDDDDDDFDDNMEMDAELMNLIFESLPEELKLKKGNLSVEDFANIDPAVMKQLIQKMTEMAPELRTGISEFEGYSISEMQTIIFELFEKDCPVQFNEMEAAAYEGIPMLNQVKCLVEIIQAQKKQELKLTAKGFLPVKVLKEIYAKGFIKDKMIEDGVSKIYREEEVQCINLARLLLELSGITKKKSGKLSLTKKGEEIIKDDHLFLKSIFIAFTDKFNWGYYDGYNFEGLGSEGCGFSFIILKKYGDERQPASFYAEKYFRALMPNLDPSQPIDKSMISCYSIRTFNRFLDYFGLVNIEYVGGFYTGEQYITKTPLLDKMIACSPFKPMMKVVR